MNSKASPSPSSTIARPTVRAWRTRFEKGVAGAGGKIVGREFTNDKATDFTSILTALKDKKPDVVFFGGMDAVAGPMLRQMKQPGIRPSSWAATASAPGPCPSCRVTRSPTVRVVCAEAGECRRRGQDGHGRLPRQVQNKFNTDVQIYAPYVYDAVNVLAEAMVKPVRPIPLYLPELAKTTGYKESPAPSPLMKRVTSERRPDALHLQGPGASRSPSCADPSPPSGPPPLLSFFDARRDARLCGHHHLWLRLRQI